MEIDDYLARNNDIEPDAQLRLVAFGVHSLIRWDGDEVLLADSLIRGLKNNKNLYEAVLRCLLAEIIKQHNNNN